MIDSGPPRWPHERLAVARRRSPASSLPEREPRRTAFERTKDELRAIPDLTADRERELVPRAQALALTILEIAD